MKISINQRVQTQRVNGGLVALHLARGEYLSLNETAAAAYEWIAKSPGATRSDLINWIQGHFDGADGDCSSDIDQLITELKDAGLVSLE